MLLSPLPPPPPPHLWASARHFLFGPWAACPVKSAPAGTCRQPRHSRHCHLIACSVLKRVRPQSDHQVKPCGKPHPDRDLQATSEQQAQPLHARQRPSTPTAPAPAHTQRPRSAEAAAPVRTAPAAEGALQPAVPAVRFAAASELVESPRRPQSAPERRGPQTRPTPQHPSPEASPALHHQSRCPQRPRLWASCAKDAAAAASRKPAALGTCAVRISSFSSSLERLHCCLFIHAQQSCLWNLEGRLAWLSAKSLAGPPSACCRRALCVRDTSVPPFTLPPAALQKVTPEWWGDGSDRPPAPHPVQHQPQPRRPPRLAYSVQPPSAADLAPPLYK